MQKLTALLFPDRTAAEHCSVSLWPWEAGGGSGKNVTASCKHTKASQRCAPLKKKVLYCPLLIFGSPYPGKAQYSSLKGSAMCPLLSVCAVFPCVQTMLWLPVLLSVCAVFPCVYTMLWLPVFGTSNGHTHVDACDCTRGLYGHRQRVCIES